MKKILFVLLVVISSLSCFAQVKYEPHILILSPKNTVCDPSLQHEVDTTNKNLTKMALLAINGMSAQKDKDVTQPENIQLMQQNSFDFLQHINLFNEISMLVQQDLTYHFFEKFPNCLLLVKDEKTSGSLTELQAIANNEQAPYILNFPGITFYKKNNQTYCKLTVQLYDRASNSLFIDKEYSGDWNNPGFEFTCEHGTMGCTISNSMAAFIPDVVQQIAEHNSTLIKERQLASERADFIRSNVYPGAFDASLVKKVVAPADSSIQTDNIYQCFYNADKTKFVAFFIKNIAKKDARSLLQDRSDQNVKIITSKKINEPGYLDQKPRTYAYIVKGVLYNNKWYYEKTEVTYFDADNITEGKIEYLNNLQGWGFFEDNSAKPGISFWEGPLFDKITDKRKDPDWEKYKDMWADEERENQDYIGLYELVAGQLKKEKEDENNSFRVQLAKTILLPFYEKQINLKQNHIAKLPDDNPEDFDLIYPKDRNVVINPIKITDEKGVNSIRYFVTLPQTKEVFEWTLVKPNIIKPGKYTDNTINETIGAFTKWNFSYKTLDDNTFWDEKVLAKEGDKFKYLEKLQ